jgi:hypothetical protein
MILAEDRTDRRHCGAGIVSRRVSLGEGLLIKEGQAVHMESAGSEQGLCAYANLEASRT